MKEFNLSDKRFKEECWTGYAHIDVREFIKKDWDLFMMFLDNKISFLELVNKRLKLAGEKLI